MQIQTISAATKLVAAELEKRGMRIYNVKMVNANRHAIIETKDKRFYVMFKRDIFHSFERQFNIPSMGESINQERLYYCLENNISQIMVVYQNGSVYAIRPIEWLNYAKAHNTFRKVEKSDYRANFGHFIPIEENTVSIDIRELRRWD